MANHIVRLRQAYRVTGPSGPITNLNTGEFASFPKKEAEWMVAQGIATWAKSVRITKEVLRADAEKVLGKSWEPRRGSKAGQCMTLEAEDADRLIKAGLAVQLVEAMVVNPHKDAQGRMREEGKFVCSVDELKEHQKNGTADEWSHPIDDMQAEELAERQAKARA